jgi:Tfp pilus assembly protein PilF
MCVASINVFAGDAMVIRGVVQDTDGNPLVGATVTLLAKGYDTPRSTETNKKGKFGIRIPDFDLVYEITVEMEGFGTAKAEFRPNPENQSPLTVTLSPGVRPPAAPSEPSPGRGEADIQSSEPVSEISEERKASIAVFNEGVAALETEDLPTALEKFKQASEIDPEFENALNAVSLTAFELDEFAVAADAAEKLLQLQPENVDVISIAYISELMIRDFERAIPAARRLAEAKPELVTDQMIQHAQVMFNENEYAGSKGLLDIVIEKEPEFAPAYLQLGLTCNALADKDCAVAALERFLELAPDDPEAATATSLLEFLQ